MENQLDQLKNELVRDIKELAAEIAKSNSFVGLISQEIKFKTLHEKFINLKFLERKNIGLDIFDQPIPVQDFSADEEDSSSDEFFGDEVFEDEKPKEYNFDKEEVEFKAEENHVSSDFTENVTDFSKDRIAEIDAGIESEDFKSTTAEVEDESFKEFEPEVMQEDESKLEVEEEESFKQVGTFEDEVNTYGEDYEKYLPKSSNLPKLQVDFNDRIAFLHQLFDGDSEAMDLVINTLNHLENPSDSHEYLKDLVREMNWADKDEYIDRLTELVQNRFD